MTYSHGACSTLHWVGWTCTCSSAELVPDNAGERKSTCGIERAQARPCWGWEGSAKREGQRRHGRISVLGILDVFYGSQLWTWLCWMTRITASTWSPAATSRLSSPKPCGLKGSGERHPSRYHRHSTTRSRIASHTQPATCHTESRRTLPCLVSPPPGPADPSTCRL